MYVDTHCHLDDDKFIDLDFVVSEYEKLNVKKVINMGIDLKTSIIGQNLSKKYNSVYFAVGFHPQNIKDTDISEAEKLKELLKDYKCVAVGEIGLDYHWDISYKEKQKEFFVKQILLAKKSGLPFCVHSRDAILDTMTILKENKNNLDYGFSVHCFSGSKETAKEVLDLNGYLGFGGTSTFKNAKNVLEVIDYCPLDKMLIETDCPYLSPEPFRGQVNSPSNIPLIAKFIANKKGIDENVFYQSVYNNSVSLYKKLTNS